MADEQQAETEVDGAGARALDDEHEVANGGESLDNTAISHQQESERLPAGRARTQQTVSTLSLQ